jgi:hypothetical protein
MFTHPRESVLHTVLETKSDDQSQKPEFATTVPGSSINDSLSGAIEFEVYKV